MSKRKTKCALCGQTGGRFRYSAEGWFHIGRCGFRDSDKAQPSPVFPFTTNHLDHPSVVAEQGPLVINNMRELRRYERMAGVASDPFSNDSDYQAGRY